MTSGIYEIRNMINQNVYYGSTKNVRIRWANHRKLLKKKKHHSRHFQRAWNKYGVHSFEWKIIEECEPVKKILIAREQYWLDTIRFKDESGILGEINQKLSYNVCPIAKSTLGFHHSKESKEKMSRAKKGKPLTEEHKRNITKNHLRLFSEKHPMWGKHPSVETIEKMKENNSGEGNPMYGKRHTDEAKLKMSELKKGKKISAEHAANIGIANAGEKSPNAQLTWAKVCEIREKYFLGHYTQKMLAKEYGVQVPCVWKVLQNLSWKESNFKEEI